MGTTEVHTDGHGHPERLRGLCDALPDRRLLCASPHGHGWPRLLSLLMGRLRLPPLPSSWAAALEPSIAGNSKFPKGKWLAKLHTLLASRGGQQQAGPSATRRALM